MDWLGSLFDLFLSIDKLDANDDFGDQFGAVEPAPVFSELPGPV
jgi:hypothetical protein